ncbi:MAG: 3-phosphoshikimate 1-carboxyvinyltransferase [Myxococcota bacterium]
MAVLRVRGPARLEGRIVAPPDKSITHRALMLAALGRGRCRVEPAGKGADNRSTAALLRALGVAITEDETGFTVDGLGDPQAFRAPEEPLDCGNSGTTMRLMTGILAGAKGAFALDGDASLRQRPMARLKPLEAMGAQLKPAGPPSPDGVLRPPFVVEAGTLKGTRHDLTVASAQVKSALLLAGLFADGPTEVKEPKRSRDHTERALRALGVRLEEAPDGTLKVWPRAEPWQVDQLGAAPDLSSAAFLLGAAAMTGSDALTVRTGVNETRAGVLDALKAFGITVHRTEAPSVSGEPVADLKVEGRPTQAAELAGALSLRSIDELPLLAAVASVAPGETVIRDAAELRVKETDRVTATVELLQAFGVDAEGRPDGMVIRGGQPLRAAEVEAGHDHRIAMTAAVLGLTAPGWTTIHGAEIIDVSYPSFASVLRAHGAEVDSA